MANEQSLVEVKIVSEADNTGTDAAKRSLGELKAEAAQANAALNSGGNVIVLERELELRQRALAIMQQHGVTEEYALKVAGRRLAAEEAITAATAQQGAAATTTAATTATAAGAAGGFGLALGGALVVAQQIYQTVIDIYEAEIRVNQEIGKQASALTAQIGIWQALAREAKTSGDLSSLAGKIIPDLDSAQTKLQDFRQKELTNWQLIQEKALAYFNVVGTAGVLGATTSLTPYSDALADATKKQEQFMVTELAAMNASITAAARSKEAWEAVQFKPLSEGVAEYTARLKAAEAALAGIDRYAGKTVDERAASLKAWQNETVEVVRAHAELKTLTDQQDRLAAASAKVADELNKIDFAKLSPPEQLQQLRSNLERIQSDLHRIGIEAATPHEALQQSNNLTAAQKAIVIGLVDEWGKTTSAIEKTGAAMEKSAAHHAATLANVKEEAAIESARASHNEGLVKQLELQRKVRQDIKAINESDLTTDEKKAAVIDRQNTALAEQKNLRPEAKTREPDPIKTYDVAGRDVTDDPFNSAGHLTRTFRSNLNPRPSDDFDIFNEPKFRHAISPGEGVGGPEGGAGKTESASSKIEAAAAKIEGAGNKLDAAGGKLETGATKVEGAGGKLDAAGGKLDAGSSKVDAAAQAMDRAATRLESSANTLSSAAESIGTAADSLTASVSNLEARISALEDDTE